MEVDFEMLVHEVEQIDFKEPRFKQRLKKVSTQLLPIEQYPKGKTTLQ